MNKKDFIERDICTKFIAPALIGAGWKHSRFREGVKLTDGRIIVRGKLAYRLQNPAAEGGPKRADYVLYAKGSIPIAVIEVKRAVYEVGYQQDFAPFGEVMHKITNRTVKRNYEICLCLYQAVTGTEEWKRIHRQLSTDFFDPVVIDECHRGSANEDSAWREVLDYFKDATHSGLTATPEEKRPAQGETQITDPEFNLKYFGNPIYTYSLKQGIEDSFLEPYKVIRVVTHADALGYTPEPGKTDKDGQLAGNAQRGGSARGYDRRFRSRRPHRLRSTAHRINIAKIRRYFLGGGDDEPVDNRRAA